MTTTLKIDYGQILFKRAFLPMILVSKKKCIYHEKRLWFFFWGIYRLTVKAVDLLDFFWGIYRLTVKAVDLLDVLVFVTIGDNNVCSAGP
jgi:hypothetical protein